MAEITFYGASDDLVEFEGAFSEEFNHYSEKPWRGLLTSPEGDSLVLTAGYGLSGGMSEWTHGVENSSTWPSWPIRFADRPDREGDPAIIITAPEGTTVEEVI